MTNTSSAPAGATELLPIGPAAARLAEALGKTDILFVASNEQRAEAVWRALAAASPDTAVLHTPSSDALPGDAAPASPANIGRRVTALHRARLATTSGKRVALVTTAEGAARLFPPPAAFEVVPPVLTQGDVLDLPTLQAELTALGYIADERVDEPGEMAVRGQVVDIFPADAGLPARIEVDDGRIAAIRAYDPATQMSTEPLDRLEIGRAAEPELGMDAVSLFDHLPDAAIVFDPDVTLRRDRFLALAADAGSSGRAERVVSPAQWDAALAGRDHNELVATEEGDVPRFASNRAPARAFAHFVKEAVARGDPIILVGGERDLRFLSPRLGTRFGQPKALRSWSEARAAAPGSIATLVMPVERGWRVPGLVVVAAADLLGSRASVDAGSGASAHPLQGLDTEISLGDVVIHEDFGIGVVAGLEPLVVDGEDAGDGIVLDYAAGARRLVPVADADRIWRYGADADAVSLDKLDGSSWQKRRAAIDTAIAESAVALTELAAERAKRISEPLVPDPVAYERFAEGFAYTETPDQARAIGAVRADLASGKPMDRLVIGDVGYGKTEVALRAAALAALAGKQVVVAAPTTVLVRQHLEVFSRRFEGTGISVAALSRLSSAAEKKAVKAGLADGSISVVIGTAAVATKGTVYRDIGLVVIDEEQRFGTADKARLRALGANCHVLTLSATPIPRTLQTALVGLQQLSVIATPPARRQPIRTSLGDFDETIVRTALLREKGRGGQSFVVVSRIEDMAPMAEKLARLVPDLAVRQAHGKMPAAEIDEAMVCFAAGDGDVLLATNIIEAGLDVPRANTMIVWRADRFGLSQLHQLRGRVGRGSRRGQIQLLTDPAHPIAEATLKRLRALQAFDQLGAGFAISARDLDMRGAGDLIGEAQAGHMKLIGTDLYQHLLEGALRTARGEVVDRWRPELHLGIFGRLPEAWVPEVDVRTVLYGRLARIADAAALDMFEAELEDRFGALPNEARSLLDVARIRLLARHALIARIDAGPAAIALTPHSGFAGDIAAAGLVPKNDRLILAEAIDDPGARLAGLAEVLETLIPD